MERIKQALEKARSEGKLAGNLRQEEEQLPPPSPPHPGVDQREEEPSLETLSYRHTRVIALDPKHLEERRIVTHNKNNLHSNTFDLLRTLVLNKMAENGWRTLAVVSPTSGAGKSVVAINLAISIARHAEKSALLVDFDLRRPSVANYLGLDLEISLTDMLEGKCELSDILVNPGIPRLVVMATHRPLANSAEILVSSRVQRLIKEIRERYEERIVIFDLPPLLNADDAIAVLPQIDCVLMVVANGMSSERDIEDALRRLTATNLLGTVFNKAQGGREAHSYY
jgi:protein-tyrosine kinase